MSNVGAIGNTTWLFTNAWDFERQAWEREMDLECVSLAPNAWDLIGLYGKTYITPTVWVSSKVRSVYVVSGQQSTLLQPARRLSKCVQCMFQPVACPWLRQGGSLSLPFPPFPLSYSLLPLPSLSFPKGSVFRIHTGREFGVFPGNFFKFSTLCGAFCCILATNLWHPVSTFVANHFLSVLRGVRGSSAPKASHWFSQRHQNGSVKPWFTITIRLRSDYDVSRAPASIRRDSTRAKMNMSIFSS